MSHNAGLGESLVRDWPEDLAMSSDVIALIERRWKEYGL